MAKSDTLILNDKLSAAKAQKTEVVVRVRDDADVILGYVGCTKWLAERQKVLLAKLVKDCGCCAAEKVEVVDGENDEDKQEEAKAPTTVTTAKSDKTEKKVRKIKPASGIEKDAGTESDLISKYGDKVIPGTLRFETDGVHAGKRTVEIRCRQLLVAEEDGSGYDWGDDFNGQTRRVATSDLFQVHGTAADHAEKRKADRRFAAKLRKLGKK